MDANATDPGSSWLALKFYFLMSRNLQDCRTGAAIWLSANAEIRNVQSRVPVRAGSAAPEASLLESELLFRLKLESAAAKSADSRLMAAIRLMG